MNRLSQGIVMAFFGGVLARMALSDVYLRYVTAWMRWPLVVTGFVLVLLGLALLVRTLTQGGDDDGHSVPAVTWLLAVPGLLFFLVSPPELGAYLAERRSGESVSAPEPSVVIPLDNADREVVPLDLVEFVWRAQDGGQSLVGHTVSVKGFVSYDEQGGWYVTQMSIGCCAADALTYQVRVEDADRPERDQWVRVSGTYVEDTGTGIGQPPVLTATDVSQIDKPVQTYG